MKDPRKHDISRSLELWERALEIIPAGTQLISRQPHRFAEGVTPVYAERAKGSRIWDVDGNEYIDYGMAVTAAVLGYADDAVDQAVIEQIPKGTSYTISSEREIELAELLIERIPCAEMVRFARGGGDACAMAVRIARGATGRDIVLFCGYHGWHDWYIAANHLSDDPLTEHLLPEIDPTGVPKALRGTVLPFSYGDLARLEQLLDEHRGQVGAIIMEPMRSELPPPGFLERIRELATRENVALIFDEVTTGFRHHANGVQPVVGVVPDMAVLAKSISNGYSMGAVVGKRWVMEPVKQMFISSTYWSELVGIVAAITTLKEVERRDVPGKLKAWGEKFQSGLQEVLDEVELPIEISGLPATPHFTFTDPDDPIEVRKRMVLLVQEMAKRGVLTGPGVPHQSAAHDDTDLGITLDAFRAACLVARDAIRDTGGVDEVLEARIYEPIFRRMVR